MQISKQSSALKSRSLNSLTLPAETSELDTKTNFSLEISNTFDRNRMEEEDAPLNNRSVKGDASTEDSTQVSEFFSLGGNFHGEKVFKAPNPLKQLRQAAKSKRKKQLSALENLMAPNSAVSIHFFTSVCYEYHLSFVLYKYYVTV